MGFCDKLFGSFMKNLLFLANLCVVIFGLLYIIYYICLYVKINEFEMISDVYNMWVIIVLGVLMLIISAFGFFAAIQEIRWCILVYAALLFIVLLAQSVCVIWIFVVREDFHNNMGSFIDKIWKKDWREMHLVEMEFKCCGVHNFHDYEIMKNPVPKSCCGDMIKDCEKGVYILRFGCKSQLLTFVDFYTDLALFGGIGAIIVEIAAIVLAIILSRHMMKHHSRQSFRHN